MRQDMFMFRPQFKLMVVGNHKPQLSSVNDAARRRFVIVPFMHKPEKPDLKLPEKLSAESPAVLRWMIDGCSDWQNNSLVIPEIVKATTADYFEEQDLKGRWIEERCECGPEKKSSASKLYESWKEYAIMNGEDPGSNTAFGSELKERGFEKKKSGGNHYLGIALKSISSLNYSTDI
jgi:putative DNA primase/helicase